MKKTNKRLVDFWKSLDNKKKTIIIVVGILTLVSVGVAVGR